MSDEHGTTRRDLLRGLAIGAAAAAATPVMHRLFVPPALAGATPGSGGPSGAVKAYVNFVINVQNFRYLDGSADTVIKLVNIFNKYGVKGDFYLTGNMAALYKASRTDAITKLKTQGICYHQRPPHPLFNGFDSRFTGAKSSELPGLIEQAETQALDMSTGEFSSKSSGGFKLVKEALGKAPACVAMPSEESTIKQAACEYYKSQGAKGVVWYHGEKSLGSAPYQYQYGLLARPSEIVIDKWKASGESSETLWWNRYTSGYPAADGKPHKRLEQRVMNWQGKRAPFVACLIHENNVQRDGSDPWLYTFWKDKEKENPRTPPYNLDAEDPSSRRSDEEQTRILQAYENMVEFAATNYKVVTMADIVEMAS